LWPKRFPAPESWIMGWIHRLIKREGYSLRRQRFLR
jgi:hypothetical protein